MVHDMIDYFPLGADAIVRMVEEIFNPQTAKEEEELCHLLTTIAERIVDECYVMFKEDVDKQAENIDCTIKDLRNELCLKCGDFDKAYLGACDNCRWRHGNV